MGNDEVTIKFTRKQADIVQSILVTVTNDPDFWGPGSYWTGHELRSAVRAQEAVSAALVENNDG